MNKLSVVVPCHNESKNIPVVFDKIRQLLDPISDLDFELIFVDDGSTDDSLDVMTTLSESQPKAEFLSFSRNFGKEAALLAGMEAATGSLVAVIDADLQDPPELLIEMVNGVLSGKHDCVAARRTTRTGEPVLRSFLSDMFYRLINSVSQVEVVSGVRDFRVMSRQYVDAVLSIKESNRFSKGIFSWVGFETKHLEYKNVERTSGGSKWSLLGLMGYAIKGILSLSSLPIVLANMVSIGLGLLSFVMAIVFALVSFSDTRLQLQMFQSFVLLACSVALLAIGVVGMYVVRIHDETRSRPPYLIRKTSIGTQQVPDQPDTNEG